MMQLFYTRNDQQLPLPEMERLLQQLPLPMQQKIRRYRRWQDQQAGLFGKLMLIEGLKRYGLSAAVLGQLEYSKFDRPSLPAMPQLDFNISHSGQLVVCVLSTELRVGIDVELIQPIDVADFQRQWTAAELEHIVAAGEEYRTFYEFWTRKEAVIKADGVGLNAPLKQIEVLSSPSRLHNVDWYWRELLIDEEYVIHLATNKVLTSNLPKVIELRWV